MNTEDDVARATDFDPDEAPESRRERYERLCKWNSLRWNGKWANKSAERERDALAVVDSVASSLELTSFQKKRARHYLEQLDSDYRQAYPIELLAFCLCGISGWLDGREYHPNVLNPNATTHNDFVLFAKEARLSYERVYSCWSQLKGDLL